MSSRGSLGWLVTVVLVLAVLALFSAGAADAATLNVPSQYPTIQAAIDAAVTGDQVVVADDVYTGAGNKNLDFGGKAITVRSESGNPAACIIDCENSGRGFNFHSGETAASIVEGLTIRNGGATYGGGVYCSNSSPTLTGCTISDNTVTNYGGGMHCLGSASPTLINCTIVSNHARFGGAGVSCASATGLTMTNCVISGNTGYSGTTDSSGGGVYSYGTSAVLTNCTISGNLVYGGEPGEGGGIYCTASASPTLTGCVITGNAAGSVGTGGMGAACSACTHPIRR